MISPDLTSADLGYSAHKVAPPTSKSAKSAAQEAVARIESTTALPKAAKFTKACAGAAQRTSRRSANSGDKLNNSIVYT